MHLIHTDRRNEAPVVAANTRVTLHFSIHLASGEEVDTTRRGKPASFTIGDGNLPAAFERALLGLRTGADERIPIAAADAFGPHRFQNIRTLRRDDFPNAADLEPGMMLAFAAAVAADASGEVPGVVRSVGEETVEVDFNHPLAGHDLVFDVTILGVEAL